MKIKLVIFLLLTFYVLRFTSYVKAQHFESSSYIIDWGNFNITSGRKNSANYSLTDTVGQNAPGAYTNNGFVVKSGFQYIYNTFTQFSFSIDNLNIAFGTLVPGIGTTATNNVTVTTPSGGGYQLMVRYNHPLKNEYGTTIPDIVAGDWTSNTDYGFGYNVVGAGHTAPINYFSSNNFYRPFTFEAQTFMSENHPVRSRSAQISYKVNVSAIQPAGNYENSIIFIAIPKY